MEKRLIARGVLAGAVGAVLAFVFARVFAEPVIGRAIAFEDERIEAQHAQGVHEHGAELFSRGVQGNAGLGFGVLLVGVALGALFAVVFCVAYGRTRAVEPQAFSIRLAVAAFVAVELIPFVKYPPNPPAVGQADTIGTRTLWYLVMLVASVALAAAAVWLGRRISTRLGAWTGGLIAAAAYLIAVAVVMTVLPTVDETPAGFPADVLYEFRLVSLGTQLVLWAAIGLVFSRLAGRLLGEPSETKRAESIVA
ncbi:CbtA family protein [Mycobacterium kubicae]|uniref:CbtA family protein n=1 Tax=Mycobacterium kubicae TaxID=120959 RepID=UPI0007FFF007|nr:CbtA family protein [Mycobacterium kubicae]OBF23997.1 cobalt transporter [Mycobacterium kubicae]QNI08834.1 CbtA family protein [Mycobacterium kubicae]